MFCFVERQRKHYVYEALSLNSTVRLIILYGYWELSIMDEQNQFRNLEYGIQCEHKVVH